MKPPTLVPDGKSSSASPAARTAGATSRRVLTGLGVVVGLALLILLGSRGGDLIPEFAAWIDGLGIWAPVVFVLGYAVAAVAFIPGSALTLAAGAVFGLAKGTLYAFVGATLGAAVSFFIARYLARSKVESRLASTPRFETIDRAIGTGGGTIVALLRLSPVFPFSLLNYALGLTAVRFLPYLVASLAMLPGTLLYVYYGTVASGLLAATSGRAAKSPLEWVLLAFGLAATIAVTTVVTRRARAALSEKTSEPGADREVHRG